MPARKSKDKPKDVPKKIYFRPKVFKVKVEKQNVVKTYGQYQLGKVNYECLRQAAKNRVVESLSELKVKNYLSFSSRCTTMAWHPRDPNKFLVGSKHGVIKLFDTRINESDECLMRMPREGTSGPGFCVTNICFDPLDYNIFYFSSISGSVEKAKIDNTAVEKVLHYTDFMLEWFTSVSVCKSAKIIAAGDTRGNLTIVDRETLKTVEKIRVHKGKTHCIDFCKKNYLFATASVDKTVKLWDMRAFKEKKPLANFQHDSGATSAYFDKTKSERILTTDQKNELRIYSASTADLETIIYHPHRHFQHMTSQRATWHPLVDLAVIGRYPDPCWSDFEHDLRTIDIFDASTGKRVKKLFNKTEKCIPSLTEFNCDGEQMASAHSTVAFAWRFPDKKEKEKKSITGSDNGGSNDDDSSDDCGNEYQFMKTEKRIKTEWSTNCCRSKPKKT